MNVVFVELRFLNAHCQVFFVTDYGTALRGNQATTFVILLNPAGGFTFSDSFMQWDSSSIINILCVGRKCNNQNYCYNIERKTVE